MSKPLNPKKCSAPTCRKFLVWARGPAGNLAPVDVTTPVYRLYRDGDEVAAERLEACGVLHFGTCTDPDAFSKGKRSPMADVAERMVAEVFAKATPSTRDDGEAHEWPVQVLELSPRSSVEISGDVDAFRQMLEGLFRVALRRRF